MGSGSEDRKCGVCGNGTTKHSHYGGVVCNSCRIFFRRGIYKHAKWKCKVGDLACAITKGRADCKLCRYKMCLQIGMNPELVDKTKKAIKLYMEEQQESRNSSITEQQEMSTTETQTNLPGEGTPATSKVPADSLKESEIFPKTIPGSENYSSSLFCGNIVQEQQSGELVANVSNCDKKFECLPKGFVKNLIPVEINTLSHSFTSDEINYFAHLTTELRKYQIQSWSAFLDMEDCRQEMMNYFSMMKSKQCESVYLPLFKHPFMGRCGEVYKRNLVDDHIRHITGLGNQTDLRSVGLKIMYNVDVFSLFLWHTMEDVTCRKNFELYGLKCDEFPFSELIPPNFSEERFPSHLRDATFNSPWAESQDLEDFFFSTAERFKALHQAPVMAVLGWFAFLGLEAQEALGSSSLDLNLLRLIIFKHVLRRTKDSTAASQTVRDMFRIYQDVERCSVIYHQASILNHLRVADPPNVDDIELQAL